MSHRFTFLDTDVVGLNARAGLRATTAWAALLGYNPNRVRSNVTALFAQITSGSAQAPRRVTQAFVQVLSHWTPNFEWIDMFNYVEFPHDISYNSIGATRFATDVSVVDSGDDQRVSRWSQPLMEYDVSYGVRTLEQLHAMVAFFRAMRGRREGFLYKDHADYTSSVATQVEARTAPAISALDQILGIGDGQTKKFQLIKRYQVLPGLEQVRPINKPVVSSVLVAVDGVPVSNFSVDATNGVVTFVPPLSLDALPPLTLVVNGPGVLGLTGAAGCFAGLSFGQHIVMTGWQHPQNNTTEQVVARITAILSDHALEVTLPSEYGLAETARAGVRIYVHPAPTNLSTVSTGYEFRVPVRFDTDRLPTTFVEHGIGDVTDVKLVELRQEDTL